MNFIPYSIPPNWNSPIHRVKTLQQIERIRAIITKIIDEEKEVPYSHIANGFDTFEYPLPYFSRTEKEIILEVYLDGEDRSEIIHRLWTPLGEVLFFDSSDTTSNIRVSKKFMESLRMQGILEHDNLPCKIKKYDFVESCGICLRNPDFQLIPSVSKFYILTFGDEVNVDKEVKIFPQILLSRSSSSATATATAGSSHVGLGSLS